LGRKLDRKELEQLEQAVVKQFGYRNVPEHNGILISEDQGNVGNLRARIEILERKMLMLMETVGTLEEKLLEEKTLNSQCTESREVKIKLESSNSFWKSYKDANNLYTTKKTYMGERREYKDLDLPRNVVDTINNILSPGQVEQDGPRKDIYTQCCSVCYLQRRVYLQEHCDDVLSILGSKRWMVRLNGWNVMARDRRRMTSECFWQDDKV